MMSKQPQFRFQGPEKKDEGRDGGYNSDQAAAQAPMQVNEDRSVKKPTPE
jgi:hypothetical protein